MPSKGSSHDRLLALQKRIYHSLKEQSERLLDEAPEAICRYEREYQEDFKKLPRKPIAMEKGDLIAEIRKADVTFIADFHTFPQAQRTALRVLRESINPGENWWLGLEIFPSNKQDLLIKYQTDEISEEAFLEATRYNEEWGFPWQNYAPLFHWAKAHGVKLIALNRPKELQSDSGDGFSELLERDRWAAGIITDIFGSRRRPRSRMIVLYGELHVGKKHLPAALSRISGESMKRPLKSISIHQNHEPLFWKVAHQGKELQTEIVRLRRGNFCVLSSTPWAKIQSLVSWAEGSCLEFNDVSSDLLSLMQGYAKVIADFLGVDAPSFDGLNLRSIQDADFAEEIDPSLISKEELRLIRYHVLHNQRIYIPKLATAYLASASENGAAELASIHLFRSMDRDEVFFELSAQGFYRSILESAFGFLGSLILNPRRKCDLIADHQDRLDQLSKGAFPSFPHEEPARQIAVAFLEAETELTTAIALLKKLLRKRFAPALHFGARYIGQALAKQIHPKILNDEIQAVQIQKIFLGRPEDIQELESATPAYWRYQSLRKLAKLDLQEMSKTLHL